MASENILENKYYAKSILFLIFCYTFINIKFYHFGDILLGLIILGTLPIFVIYKKTIFKDPIVILFALVLILQILSWLNSVIFAPEFANKAPTPDRLGKLFVFFFIAYWLKGNLKNVIMLWLFFIFGFLFTIVLNVDISYLYDLTFTHERADFLIKNSQFDSMLAGTSLLISLFLFYLTYHADIFSKNIKRLLLFGTFVSILLFIYLVVITQSRQVWLGLFIAIVVGIITYVKIYHIKNIKMILIGALLTVGAFVLLTNSSIIQERISDEQTTIDSIIDQNTSIEMSSIGIRVSSWLDALEWIQRHPILGLDSEAIPEVIRQSERFDESLKKRFGHLHNFFIETLVAYGFIGLFFMLALYYFIIKSIKDDSLSHENRKIFFPFAITFLLYWLIINNFETFNSRWLGVYVNNIIMASFYTFYLTNSLEAKKPTLS